MPHAFPKPLPISLAIINKNEHRLGCFSHHSTWNTCPMTLVLYFLHGFLTRAVTKLGTPEPFELVLELSPRSSLQ